MFTSNIKDRQSAPKKAWRKRRLIAIASMLLLLAVGLIWLVPNKPELLLQGKPESWWVNGLLGHATNSAPWASLGTNGVQLLIKTLENKGGPFHNAYAKIWPRLPAVLHDRLAGPVELAPFRFEAATKLAEMGPEAKIAVPALVRALDDDDSGVRMNAANSLGFLGKDDKAIMRFFPQALLNTNKWVRGNIVSALASCQPSAESTAMLLKAMTDPEPGIRTSATTFY